MGNALYQAFLKMDEYLDSPKGRKEVNQVAAERGEEMEDGLDGDDDDEDDDDEDDMEIATGVKKETKVSDSKRDASAMWAQAAGPDGMGCTSVVALLKGGPKPEVWVANAG